MNKKILLINFIVSLILAVISSFFIVGPYDCVNECIGEPCYICHPTPLFIRVPLIIILFFAFLGIVYLFEFIYKKFKK